MSLCPSRDPPVHFPPGGLYDRCLRVSLLSGRVVAQSGAAGADHCIGRHGTEFRLALAARTVEAFGGAQAEATCCDQDGCNAPGTSWRPKPLSSTVALQSKFKHTAALGQ